jgi:CheY-like chemotaxis protein/anti-sigma regulatory factor (Ser/Thr protein kinase)
LGDLVRRQEAAIDSATRLLNALLDISRLESGAIDPQLSGVRLAAMFAELAQEFEGAAATKNLQLVFPQTEIVLSTDRTLFAQLLQNLIGNALKYTERGYVRLSQSLESDALVLNIEDSGVGIPEDKLDRIFDEYYQIGPHGTKRLGVGLGLAIVREVSRLLGYSVVVTSTPAEGTCVSVRIPRHRLLADTAALMQQESTEAPTNGAARCRLVLLEDNDSVRAATELFLTLEGFETKTAATVAEARTLLQQMQPGDVFITDYHLDGQLTGLDVLQELRRREGRDVPAILLSGDLHSVMRAVKTSIPHCRFLGKPVDTKALLSAINEVGAD